MDCPTSDNDNNNNKSSSGEIQFTDKGSDWRQIRTSSENRVMLATNNTQSLEASNRASGRRDKKGNQLAALAAINNVNNNLTTSGGENRSEGRGQMYYSEVCNVEGSYIPAAGVGLTQ